MRCSVPDCPGEYEQREVVRAMHQGDRIIVVEHIPAEVCDVCGDVLFTPETIERLAHCSSLQVCQFRVDACFSPLVPER